MLGKLHVLLATACIVALIAQGHAICKDTKWGTQTDNVSVVGPVGVPAEPSEVDVKLPYRELLGCEVVGVHAFTCDSPDDTQLYFVGKYTVDVSRKYTSREGTLYGIIYCKPITRPPTKASNSWQ